MKDSEKSELVRLARLANEDPNGSDFWDEVERIQEEDSKGPLVKPRRETE